MSDTRKAAPPPSGPSLWTVVTGLAFAFFVAAGASHALLALYASGQAIARLDVQRGSIVTLPGVTYSRSGPRATQVGPIELSPAMNPLRVVLHTRYTPRVGNRISYRVAMVASGGMQTWERQGFLGGDEDVSSVDASSIVQTFDVSAPGPRAFEIGFSFRTLDDLESASLEVRRNVTPVNRPWIALCAIAAGTALVANLVTQQRRPTPSSAPERRAA